ncbi:MAG: acyl-CoA synthetase [Hyphomonadaceae bacterium]|nr:acyl-CoA synthetase [Hyphomonadaceae bacterium]
MHPRAHAATHPDKPVIVMTGSGRTVTFGELEDRANRTAQMFRGLGLQTGDVIAILMENLPEYFELTWGAQRSGLYYVCISTKLTGGEIAYILEDSGAKALFISPGLATAGLEALAEPTAKAAGVRGFSVGGDIAGLPSYVDTRATYPNAPIADETAGADMLYSSGTTGRPKGVRVALSGLEIDAPNPLMMLTQALYGLGAHSRYLTPAPLYHAAPLRWTMSLQRFGATTFIMEKFDPETYLAVVEKYQINASQLVPTMFVRMLKLPPEVRAKYDVSSMQMAIHAAAPCPVAVKEAMMDWWGPVIHEYYAGTEGNGFCSIGPQEWLANKGSVGKAILGELKICDENGDEVPPGVEGAVFFANGPEFQYHNSPEKTAESKNKHGWSTLGDVGYVNEGGYLFLTDRKAFMIISGGVNIYPQEVENLLVTHPKVADAAVFGIPNEDFGEEVKAAIQLLDPASAGPEVEAELLEFCRQHLSHIKCPRSIDFHVELPRHPTGKLYKRLLRDAYWGGKQSKIV